MVNQLDLDAALTFNAIMSILMLTLIAINLFFIWLVIKSFKQLKPSEATLFITDSILFILMCFSSVLQLLAYDKFFRVHKFICIFSGLVSVASYFQVSALLVFHSLIHFSAFNRSKLFIRVNTLVNQKKVVIIYISLVVILSYTVYLTLFLIISHQLVFNSSADENIVCNQNLTKFSVILYSSTNFPWLFLIFIYIYAIISFRKLKKASTNIKTTTQNRNLMVMKKFLIYSLVSALICLPFTINIMVGYFCAQCLSPAISYMLNILSLAGMFIQPIMVLINHSKLRESFLSLFRK